MAAWVLLLGILFTEVLEPICTSGVRAAGNNIIVKNGLKNEMKVDNNNSIVRTNENLRIEPEGTIILGKQNLTLNCISVNNNVFWLFDDEPAPSCGNLSCDTLNNGSLHFFKKQNLTLAYKSKGSKVNVSKKHEIRCIGQSTSGGYLRSSPTFLQIADLSHSFRSNPNDLTVQEGGIARLSCLIETIPFPPNITWYHNDQPIIFDGNNNTKYFMVPPGVLYIIATQQSDAGSYKCVVTNGYIKKKKKSKEAKLTVIPNENVSNTKGYLYSQSSYNHTLIQGSNFTLVCAAFGYPLPLVKWTFISKYSDNTDVSQSHILRNSTSGISILSLKNVSTDDAGTYLCSMENNPSNGVEIQNITVDVAVPPFFIKKPTNQVCPNGRTVRFECQAHGYPPPKIYWLKDSANIVINEGRKTTYFKEDNKVEFAVSATVLADSGEYQCVAVNIAGEIWAAGRLQVNTPKNFLIAPKSLKCTAESPFKIKISWTPSTSLPSSVTAYTVHYKTIREKSIEDEKEEVLPVLSNVTSVEVTNHLEPNTNYSFYVRVWNKQEASDQSSNITCTTPPTVPKSTPEVLIKILSSTKLNVTWKPLTKKEARGNIEEYKVQWRLHDHPSSRTFIVPVNVTHHILTDLIAGYQYDVRVLARTAQGWPKNFNLNWTQVVMPKDVSASYKMKNMWDLQLISLNSSHLKMIWRMKSSRKIEELKFDSWKIFYESRNGNKYFNTDLEKHNREYLFRNLEENISYTVGICININNVSKDCLTKIVRPSKYNSGNIIVDLEAIPLSSTEIQLTWNVSNETDIKQFQVHHRGIENLRSNGLVIVSNTTLLINRLLPYTMYQFTVTPVQDNLPFDDLSETIECTTNEDLPSEPVKVQSVLNSTSLIIIWEKPMYPNGVILSYLVHFYSTSEPIYSKNITVLGNVTFVSFPQLQYEKTYYAVVRAATKVGYGKPSHPHSVYYKSIRITSPDKQVPPTKSNPDQSLGVILGISISIFFIFLSLCSIYCRKKWESSRSLRESTQPFKNHILSRNGNVCCVDQSSTSANQQTINQTCNEVELAVLCPSSPTLTNHPSDKGIVSNGIVEACAKEPLLSPWSVDDEKKDHHITEMSEYKDKDSSVSSKHSETEMDLDETELTMVDDSIIEERNTSLNNNLGCSASSPEGKIIPALVPLLETNG